MEEQKNSCQEVDNLIDQQSNTINELHEEPIKDNENTQQSHQDMINDVFKLTKEEKDLITYNWKERMLYYYAYPWYFLKVLYTSIKTFSWKL